MGDEEHATGTDLLGIEGREPGLAKARGEDDQTAQIAFVPGARECGQCFLLDRRWAWRLFVLLRARLDRPWRWDAACFVALDPRVGELYRTRVSEEFFESGARFEEAIVTWIVDAVIPFQPVGERGPADVARANEDGAVQRARVGEVGK